jgi:uncharacterized damage-inducible protein DinB
MTDSTPDPTLDRLLRHMAWANASLFDSLSTLTDADLAMAAPRNEWSAARILEHLVNAAGGYAARLERVPRAAPISLATIADLAGAAATAADYDARLRAQAAVPEEPVPHTDHPERGPRARSTILAQAIHHATEHRAQVAGALATNDVDVIDLDALDLWAYGEAEGVGA